MWLDCKKGLKKKKGEYIGVPVYLVMDIRWMVKNSTSEDKQPGGQDDLLCRHQFAFFPTHINLVQ